MQQILRKLRFVTAESELSDLEVLISSFFQRTGDGKRKYEKEEGQKEKSR